MSTTSAGHDFDPLTPETFTSAHAELAELRARCPVAHSETFDGFWAFLSYDAVTMALRSPSTYVTSVQNVVPKVAYTGRRPPLHLDPPEHTPYRHALNPFFTEEATRRREPMVRRVTVDLLAPFIEAGGGDICAEFTHHYSGHVFAEVFNLTPELAMDIKEVTVRYNRALQEADDPTVKSTSLELYEIASTVIQMRKAEPLGDDITTALLAKRVDGEPLPDQMILGTIRQLLVVGMIAPSVFIGSMVVHLSENPDLQDQLRGDLALVPAAVEEYLRLFTPYRGFARTATHDVEVGGRTIPKDEPIALVYASANRDESVFPDGGTFVLNRPNIADHVAFGLGPHRCAGETLARLMLRTTLEELLSRTRSIEVNGEVVMTRWPEWGTLVCPVSVVPA